MSPLETVAVARFGRVVAEARGMAEVWRRGTTYGPLQGLQVAGVCDDTAEAGRTRLLEDVAVARFGHVAAEARGMFEAWRRGTTRGPLLRPQAAGASDDTTDACGAAVWRGGTTREPARRRALVAPHWTKQRRRCA